MKQLFLFFLVLISFSSYAQTSEKQVSEVKPELKAKRQVASMSHPTSPSVSNENDPYYGRKEEFARMFITGQVPVDFPTYTTGANLDNYNLEIKKYLQSNRSLLTEKYQEKYSN